MNFPLPCFVGLAVGGVEVAVPGYVRQAAVLAYCEDGVTVANASSLQWQHATASWDVIDTVQLWDAAAAGKQLGVVPVIPLEIRQYDIARIPASGITASYTRVWRAYGTGAFGTLKFGGSSDVFAALTAVLERAFDHQHVCAPGTWAPGPFSLAA